MTMWIDKPAHEHGHVSRAALLRRNPSGFAPGRIHIHARTVPGKRPRLFGPGFNRYGSPLMTKRILT